MCEKQGLKVPGPGPGSKVPTFFTQKVRGPRSGFSKTEKKVQGPRSAILKVGKKVQVQGPPNLAGPGDLKI
jgi:hypothetical protein